MQHFDLLFVCYSFVLLLLLPWLSCAYEDMPKRMPESNVIADATCVAGVYWQHSARVCGQLLAGLDEVHSWFDSEPGGCPPDSLSANTGRLRVAGAVVDPNVSVKYHAMTKLERQGRVGVVSTLRRTLKRTRVRRRARHVLKRAQRSATIEERPVHFLMTVPATASPFRAHEYSQNGLR